MGECLSKKSGPSIDVSGNNNYAVLINGVQVNIASILGEIADYIDAENLRLILIICSSCALTTMLLIIVLICILLPKRHRRIRSDITMRDIEENIIHLNERIEELASIADHLSMISYHYKINSQSDQICVEKHPELSL